MWEDLTLVAMLKTKKIDFKQIAPRNGSQTDAFEEFCCQIARHSEGLPSGSEFVRFRGAGGEAAESGQPFVRVP